MISMRSLLIVVAIASTAFPFSLQASITPSGLVQGECESTLSALNQYLHPIFVAGASAYEIELTDDAQCHHIWSINQNLHDPFFALHQVPGIKYATKYRIRIRAKVGHRWGAFGDWCVVNTPAEQPLPKLAEQHCNRKMVSIYDYIHVTPIPGATRYMYEITDASGEAERWFSPPGIPGATFTSINFYGIYYDSLYTVRVAAKVDGEWGEFGESCPIYTPSMQKPSLREDYCGVQLQSKNDYIYVPDIHMSEGYAFEITDNEGYYAVDTLDGCPPPPSFAIGHLGGLMPNKTYDVRFKVWYNKEWTPYGPKCQVTMPPPAPTVWDLIGGGPDDPKARTDSDWEDLALELTVWPNPCIDKVQIKLNGMQYLSLPARVRCFDVAGIQVYSAAQTLTAAGLELDFINAPGFRDGAYIIELTVANRTFRRKFLKQSQVQE